MCGLKSAGGAIGAIAMPGLSLASSLIPKAPKTPDPTQTANTQQQMNINSAIAQQNLNRVNQYTPYGSSVYTQTGTNADGTPQYSQTVSLSPQMKALYDAQVNQDQGLTTGENKLIDQINSNFGKGADTSSFSPVTGGMSSNDLNGWMGRFLTNSGPTHYAGTQQAGVTGAGYGSIQDRLTTGDLNHAFDQQQQAAYDKQMSYLQPQQQQQMDQLKDQLAQQGITQASNPTAYANAMQLLSNQQNFAKQQAFDSSYQSGLQGANQLFNQDLQSGEFANSAQAQGFGQSATNAQFANNAALENAQMGNSVGMYNAGQGNQMDLSNAQLNNQALGAEMSGYGANAGLNNQANAQEYQNLFSLQNQPINQLSTLRGVSQVQNPTFGATPQASVNAPNYQGLVQQNYANQLGSYNNFMKGLFSLGSSAIGLAM